MYCWGNTVHGELGLGGIEDEQIFVPQELPFSRTTDICQVACGENHTVIVTKEGKVYTCGNNAHGQLGHTKPCKRPEQVEALAPYSIVRVASGKVHNLAINDWGLVFGWGSDENGQLGLRSGKSLQLPKALKLLGTKHVIQIACGDYHSLALTNNGELYVWGSNSHGQLGLGQINRPHEDVPCLVKTLMGIPIAFIACGGCHSFVISKSGAVFGWGRNAFGQLGIGEKHDKCFPTQLRSMRTLKVKYIACGSDHTVFLTDDGGVFSCGAGMYGQLGHGSTAPELLPRKILELMGSTVTQIACGRCHTLAYVPQQDRLYAFGVGAAGQLGSATLNSLTPKLIERHWTNANMDTDDMSISKLCTVKEIYSGGDQCFAIITQDEQPVDFRIYLDTSQIWILTIERINMFLNVIEPVDQDLMRYAETVFSSSNCFNGSFLKNNEHFCCSFKNSGVDFEQVQEAFSLIYRIQHDVLKDLVFDHLTNDLLKDLPQSPPDIEALRLYLYLPLYHEFMQPVHYQKLQCAFGMAVLNLSKEAGKIVGIWWSWTSAEYFERLITIFKNVIVYILNLPDSNDFGELKAREHGITVSLDILHKLNQLNHDKKLKVPYDTFYIPEISIKVDVRLDYLKWVSEKNTQPKMFFCNYPFVFDAHAKTKLLQTDQTLQMHSAMNAATHQIFELFLTSPELLNPVEIQFLYLPVSRDNIVYDTMAALQEVPESALKKPLKVKFKGEEAEDAGGVTKEFFMLLLKELLDPKYGMFRQYEETYCMWFSDEYFEDVTMYYMIGMLCGLAIYNFTIIDLPFPLALYRKLLNETVSLEDLAGLQPVMAKSLEELQLYEGDDVEEVFSLTFEILRDIYGATKHFELVENGANLPVTKDNKDEYVRLYVDFVLNKSVKIQFDMFSKGFHKVCGGRIIKLFHARELMALVVGNENYDWKVLEKNTEYKNGYYAGHPTIKLFWEVFHEFPLEEKKKFLLFLTGCDRIPILGMETVQLIIQPTNDEKYLPVAHTCFNLLDLPMYKTKERLRYKLLQAIQQNQGFSLV